MENGSNSALKMHSESTILITAFFLGAAGNCFIKADCFLRNRQHEYRYFLIIAITTDQTDVPFKTE